MNATLTKPLDNKRVKVSVKEQPKEVDQMSDRIRELKIFHAKYHQILSPDPRSSGISACEKAGATYFEDVLNRWGVD
ncbi:unnamed protein product [Toxocara canis]|uniref:DUF2508 family protein n=1 Tax=Toxocara canis TaxID=6265 RepID=A0A183UWF2_TOXCA|nr:unnamed protein product [Toxocara canis]